MARNATDEDALQIITKRSQREQHVKNKGCHITTPRPLRPRTGHPHPSCKQDTFSYLEKATVTHPFGNRRHIFVPFIAGGGTPPLQRFPRFREQAVHLRPFYRGRFVNRPYRIDGASSSYHMRRHTRRRPTIGWNKTYIHVTKNATYVRKNAPRGCVFVLFFTIRYSCRRSCNSKESTHCSSLPPPILPLYRSS